MSNTIPLYENAHATTQRLLPWYLNGSLDESERQIVAEHLQACAECRAELALEREFGADVASLAPTADQGWTKIRSRIATSPAAPAKIVWFRRRIPLGWAVGAQAIAATLLIGLLLAPQLRQTRPDAAFRALGSSVAAPRGNVIVIFAGSATERDMRRAIQQADARLVDGPTASGAWLLEVADANRPAALRRLHADQAVSLAEPIDAGTAP